DHHLEWSADSYFARTFRFNVVSLGFAMLLPRRFFLASGARNLRLDRSSAHCSLVIRSLSRSLPVFPDGGEVHASEVDQFIRSKHGSYVFGQFAAVIGISALLYRYYELRRTHLRE